MLTIDPKTIPQPDFYQYMIGAIAPRPIAFVSTLDAEGVPNLAPYSFFNAVSSKPPLVVFSAARRATDNTTKDTLDNVTARKECVINVVSHAIVRQMVLTSQKYPKDVSEFTKSGLTPIASEMVAPFRVAESPVQMECRVREILALGTEGGAGNLVVCEIVRMHINEVVIDERGRIDPHKIDLVGRLGRANYVRASGGAIFDIVLPENPLALGYDSLPLSILKSEVLTGNEIAQIASLVAVPTQEEVSALKKDVRVQKMMFSQHKIQALHLLAQEELKKGNTLMGAQLAFLGEYL